MSLSVRDLVLASRPVSWVNTAYPFAAAYLLATRAVDARLIVGTLFFLVPYNLLMYGVNDVFDHESDLANPRKGGAEGGLVDPGALRSLLLASLALPVPFVVWLLAQGSAAAGVVLVLCLAAVLGYSVPGLRLKERPVLDSMTSSAHFVGPAVYGLVLADIAVPQRIWPIVAAFFAWGMASHAFGAVQDVLPDRAGGIRSIATQLGARRVVRLATLAYLVSSVLLLLGPWPAPLAALLPLPYAWLVWRHRDVTDETSATTNRGWRHFLGLNYLTGFLVTQLLIAAVMWW